MNSLRLFLAGDTMTGRGIDQILEHPCEPQLFETYVKDARDYVFLAEEKNGKISFPVTMDYIWGDALPLWKQFNPVLKIINLETTITLSNDYLPQKSIHYRMSPMNVSALTAAGINVCTLANNHILDWGFQGIRDTVATLNKTGIKSSGVGNCIKEAMQPAIFELSFNKRILVFSAGMSSSGISPDWEATKELPGLYFLSDTSEDTLGSLAHHIKSHRHSNDLIIFSIHWGSNWGYEITESDRIFAHRLIDIAKVDVVFGHSSHHPRSIERYHNKPILYGCGDFLNDYEGISGFEAYRSDLTLMYFLDFDYINLQFKKMILVPMQIKKFSLHRANREDSKWMLARLNQNSSMDMKLNNDHFICVK